MAFDSDSDPSADAQNPRAPMFRAIVGSKFTIFTDADGTPIRVEGFEELVEKITASVPPEMRGMMENVLTENMVKEYGNLGNEELPDKPVKIGDEWPFRKKMEIPILGEMDVDLKYKFKEWQEREGKRYALITFSGTMEIKQGEKAQVQGMEMSFKGTEMSGQSLFDPDLGMFVEDIIDQSFDMEMSVNPGNTQQTMAMKIQQHIVTTVTKVE